MSQSHYRPYRSYQDAPAEWLGEVPAHWAVERMKYGLRQKASRKAPELPPGAISYGEVVQKDAERIAPETRETYQEVLPGEYLINPINLNYDLVSLRAGLSNISVCVSPAYIVLHPRLEKLNPVFGKYLLHVFDVRHMKTLGAGVRQTITFGDIGRCVWSLPPVDEQASIATYLDRETARIDGLIEKKARFIALLKEKRVAVIGRAVTRGIDQNVDLIETGLPWIGLAPVHWQVRPIKALFEFLDGKRVPISSEERGTMQGEYPYYGASGIIDYVVDYVFDEDLILVSEDGANLLYRTYRIAFIATGKYWVNNHAHVLRPIDGCLRFWADRLEEIDLSSFITGSTQPKLTIENLMNIRVSMPPNFSERQAIAEWIATKIPRLDTLITKTEQSIALLKEKRAALITAAVTGKIDVRSAA